MKSKLVLTFFLIFCTVAFAQKVKNTPPKNKKELLIENTKQSKEIDSLKTLLIFAYEQNNILRDSLKLAYESIATEPIIYSKPNIEYSIESSDSLLNLYYLQKLNAKCSEKTDYDLDSVVFTSNVPDSVYLRRLADMNSFITLPYNDRVRNSIIMYSEKMPTRMARMLGISRYYFPIFEEILNKYDMPLELKYMAVIESAFNPVAISKAGAAGMWQFMYSTAKLYGLKINSYVDERFDIYKSADAAARYMLDAYGIFGDWNLAICSYNCGAGNVNKAIRRAGSREFWDIYEYLPRETRGYVPAFVGAMYAFTYYKEHGIEPERVNLPMFTDTISVNKMLHFKQIEEVVGIPVSTLKELNPQYRNDIIPGGKTPYTLILPYQYTAAFVDREDSVYVHNSKVYFSEATLQNIKNSSTNNAISYKVVNGDYLGKIANRYHVTVGQIKQWNNLRSNNLRIGQRLIIYPRGYSAPIVPASPKAPSPLVLSGEFVLYTVQEGESLYTIAKKYSGVSAQNIMDYNGISSKLKVGQQIKIPILK